MRFSNSRPREYYLHDHDGAYEMRQGRYDDGDDRDACVPQRVPADYEPLAQPLGPRGAHVVLVKRLQHSRPGHSRHSGRKSGRKGNSRQDDVLPTSRPGCGQKSKLNRKDNYQHDAEPELGHHDAKDRYPRGEVVQDGTSIQRCDDAQGESRNYADGRGEQSEPEAVGQTVDDELRDRDAVPEGIAELSLDRPPPEEEVLNDDVAVEACRVFMGVGDGYSRLNSFSTCQKSNCSTPCVRYMPTASAPLSLAIRPASIMRSGSWKLLGW